MRRDILNLGTILQKPTDFWDLFFPLPRRIVLFQNFVGLRIPVLFVKQSDDSNHLPYRQMKVNQSMEYTRKVGGSRSAIRHKWERNECLIHFEFVG